MIIPREISRFTSEDVLLVVTGKQDAKLYRARRGMLDIIDDFKIETPVYSDKEEFFKNSTAEEHINDTVMREFNQELTKRLKRISVTIPVRKVYVFTPAYMKRIILTMFPTLLGRKIHMIFEGNYYHEHPLILIKRIHDASQHALERSAYGDAKKILDISNKARNVIRHRG